MKLTRIKHLAFVFLIIGALLGCTQASPTPSPVVATGTGVFAITDAAVDMGAITKIVATIDSVRVHQEGGDWVAVTSTPITVDLLELRSTGVAALLAQVELEAGTYNEIELRVSKLIVTDAQGEHEAKLPSGKLQLKGKLEIEAGATSTANFDFLADQSLHLTGEGTYIFAPVVRLETRAKAEAKVEPGKREVKISGGRTTANIHIGMDAEGNTDIGLRITPNAVLRVLPNGKVLQVRGDALAVGTLKGVEQASGAVTITTRGGAELTLYLASDTEVKLNGSDATLATLANQVGAEVVARYNAETKVLSRIVLGSDAKARAETAANLDLSGSIRSVDISRGTITVKTDTGAEVTLKLGADAALNLGGTVSGIVGLEGKAGSRVKLDFDATTGSVKRLEGGAEGETEVAVQGTLKSIDVAKSQITVTLADGKDITLDVSSRSKVNVEGSISPLPGLKRVIGSQVSVEYSPEMKVVGALNARAGPGGTIDVTGIIKAVNPAQGKVTIQTPDGREVEIDVTAASTIVADGTISSLVALAGKVGEELSVKLDARTNAPLSLKAQASGDAHAAGTLKAVDASAGTIIIATGASGDTTLTVDASTQVEIGGDSATLADLASKIGTQIVAEYSSNTSIATEVKVAGRSGMVSKSMGTIRSVDQAAGTVTMAAEGSADLTVMVSSDTRIQIGPAEGTLANLAAQVGARAFVEYAAGTLAASRITVQGAGSPRAAVSGTLKAVNEGASVITVAPQTGSEVVLKVSANTKILVGGKASALAALVALVGSRVAVQYDAQTSTALAVEASGGAFPTNAHLEATLKAVDQTNGTVTITSGAGVDIALKVDGLTRLTLDGAATTLAALSGQVGARAVADYVVQAQTATLIAVSTAGDDRAATGSGSATGPSGGRGSGEANSGNGSGAGGGTSSGSTANRASISIAGTLKGVNVVSGTVDIADQYGILLTLKVSTQSKISVKGTTGSLAQLATMLGAEVRAEYDASTMTVVSLSV